MRRMLLAMVLASLCAPDAAAQSDPSSGWSPYLLVRAFPSYADGMRGAVSTDRRLAKDETGGSITMWTSRGLCSIGGGINDPSQIGPPPVNMWRMTSEYLGEKDGRYQVKVTSGFTRLDNRDTSATTTQTLSLREGDEVVLDVLSAPVDQSCPVHTIVFQARLIMKPADKALARARYTADLWLVHAEPNGEERRQHLVLSADGTNPAPFSFNRLAFPIPQIDPRQGSMQAVIVMSGALRLRPRPDGRIDVDVETNSSPFRLERPENPMSDSLFGNNRKTVTMQEDETTAIEFPARGMASMSLFDGKTPTSSGTGGGAGAAGGFVARPSPASSSEPAAVEIVRGDRMNLHLATFYKGHKTQLLVTLKRVN